MSSRIPSIGHVQVFQKMLLEESLQEGDRVLDATVGNGHDSLMLLEYVGPTGFLIGFDVQREAVENTRSKLEQAGKNNFQLICDTHAELGKYVLEPFQGALFNLGYLPTGNKGCTTLWTSTKSAIDQAMNLLLPNGFIGVMTYPGHDSGMEEDLEIRGFFAQVNQKEFQIAQIEFINQKNNPPKLYWLTKRT